MRPPPVGSKSPAPLRASPRSRGSPKMSRSSCGRLPPAAAPSSRRAHKTAGSGFGRFRKRGGAQGPRCRSEHGAPDADAARRTYWISKARGQRSRRRPRASRREAALFLPRPLPATHPYDFADERARALLDGHMLDADGLLASAAPAGDGLGQFAPPASQLLGPAEHDQPTESRVTRIGERPPAQAMALGRLLPAIAPAFVDVATNERIHLVLA